MKYVDEFRDGDLATRLARAIQREVDPNRCYRLMEFCGGHTHTLSRYGIEDLLPGNIRMIHGPGCPVCVLPTARLQSAIRLAARPDVTLCTYADLMRVPVAKGDSLLRTKARGADIRMVYSVADALDIARGNPGREVVFLAVGFETTTPPTAVAISEAKRDQVANFSVLCNHVLTPAAMRAILELAPDRTDGRGTSTASWGPRTSAPSSGPGPTSRSPRSSSDRWWLPGSSRSTSCTPSSCSCARSTTAAPRWRISSRGPCAAKATSRLNDWSRTCSSSGTLSSGEGSASCLIAHSASSGSYGDHDAERRFDTEVAPIPDPKACECAAILRGVKQPIDCKVFGTVCTPDTPIGSCMVSSEGACAAHYTYGRHRDHPRSA